MQRPRFHLFSLLVFLCIAPDVAADITGSIRGCVTDSDGNALAGATVTATSDVLVVGSRSNTIGPTGAFRLMASSLRRCHRSLGDPLGPAGSEFGSHLGSDPARSAAVQAGVLRF